MIKQKYRKGDLDDRRIGIFKRVADFGEISL